MESGTEADLKEEAGAALTDSAIVFVCVCMCVEDTGLCTLPPPASYSHASSQGARSGPVRSEIPRPRLAALLQM